MQLTKMLEAMMERGAGDLHLQAGSAPMLRVGGRLEALDGAVMTDDHIRELMSQVAYEDAQVRLDEARSADFSFEMPGRARFRCNAFYERGHLSMALRLVPIQIPPFEELNLPYAVQEIAQSPRGLILVTGTTGSGKSTTLAAIIDYINTHRAERIITVEDPIEFVHTSKKSLIAQRELGGDTKSFLGSLREALREYSGVDVDQYPDASSLAQRMRELEITVTSEESRGRLIDKLISATVEPHLVQPTFLLDYPVEMSPLAKSKPDDPGYVERFEAFAAGMEIANAFTELNDPQVQRQRLEEQEALRKQFHGEELDRLDEDFLVALEYGMPPAGGLGMGMDRLVMLLTDQKSIRDVVLFPQLRSQGP